METTEKQETALVPVLKLSPFEAKKEELTKLASDYKNMVVTKENLKEANEARLVLYRKRIQIQNTAKENRKAIKDFLKTNNDAVEEELIGTIQPTELDLEAKIKAVKDAIAEQERIEAARIAKHKAALEKTKDLIVTITNLTDIEAVKHWVNVDETELDDLEEFKAEGEQLTLTLKETAKNRLEMLEFQAKKKADEEAAAQKLIDDEKAKKNLEEKENQEGFDMVEAPIEAESKDNLEKIDNTPSTEFGPSGSDYTPFGEGMPLQEFNMPTKILKIMKTSGTVPIVATTKLSDKEQMNFLSKQFQHFIETVNTPIFSSETATTHKEYLVTMLNKLAEQTLKVAEKL